MFMAVPPSYDFLNRLLTFRMDELWRRKAAQIILTGQPGRILDLCSGTGDLALRLGKNALNGTEVLALDYSEPMLEQARKKALKRKIDNVNFIHGDAASMPFSDGYFDRVGIAFAFRNLTFKNPDTEKFLSEIIRVLKSGGLFVAVETSQPANKVWRHLYHFYLRYITAPLGGVISGHGHAYRYLSWSALNFYENEDMKKILLNSGFSQVNYTSLFGGIAAIWVCKK
jgi:demethylmenaquinone methyltransferase / 2-methoxy-6-polyprenyl-1,4-benzoquinol methylase